MPETDVQPVSPGGPPVKNGGFLHGRLLRAEVLAIFMLVAGFIGSALSGVSGSALILWWEFLVPVYALICILSGWASAGTRGERTRLVWTQILHWLGCFAAMRILFIPNLHGVMNDNATGLMLLTVLALGTFLAGLHARTWQITVVGVLLALSVPAAAWLEQSALLLALQAVAVVVAGGVFLWARSWWRHKGVAGKPA